MAQRTLTEAATGVQDTGKVVVEEVGRHTRIHHTAGDAEAGFDLTEFASAGRWRAVLDELGIDAEPEKVVTSGQEDSDDCRAVWIWANDHIMLVTGANPLTGELVYFGSRNKDTGYASYIGIEGRGPDVLTAYEAIKDKQSFTEGWDPDSRSYL